MSFEIGIYHFGELTADPVTGHRSTPAQRMRELIEQAAVADQAGLSVFGLGEHHRGDFAVSAPEVLLGAMAERTEHIHLSPAVIVLSSDDPVRVFERISVLDNLSGGRAELIVGRGSYTESFPLFGYNLADYDGLFESKLDLLDRIQRENPVTWSGPFRAPLKAADIAPRPVDGRTIPTWVAVGGTPASAVRAARQGLPMALGILGGRLDGFAPFVDLYRRAWAAEGRDPAQARVSVNGPGFVADTSQRAISVSHPYFAAGMMENFHQRGEGYAVPEQVYRAMASDEGALFVGSPAQIVDKILAQHEAYRHERYIMQIGYGNVPQRETLHAIELLGTEVLPQVRAALGAGANPDAASSGSPLPGVGVSDAEEVRS
ncbi:MAG: LLM class flavin-dependent oxidoreductase [Microbacteriaceae bacterium]|jgi:probable LLM family oxidoreductase|nr:LLM class flavin-dependent oxidoreductase [Microbacteriaceae bacterium]MCI1207084.1 LLM class flavin-dependent oxidoreductase [Microbacteriaceae bacterium]